MPNVLAAITGGGAKALAVASKTRLAALPNVPTTAEAGIPSYVVSGWFIMLAPRGTPQPVVDKLNYELSADLGSLQASHPNVTIVSADLAGLLTKITQHPSTYGFVNTTDATGPLQPGSVFLAAVTAPNAQNYLFFDGVHPTSKASQLLGLETAAAVGSKSHAT